MSVHRKPQSQITKKESKRKGKGFRRILTDRNHLIIGVYELFFRKEMGERYFDRGTLIAIIVGLCGLKCLLSFPSFYVWMTGAIVPTAISGVAPAPASFPFCRFDIFILICLVLGIYHLRQQRKARAAGRRINSMFMGTSRFRKFGKFFNEKNPQFGAYLFIEPVVALFVSFIAISHSLFLFLFGVIGAGRLWYENYLVVREYKDTMYDMEDAVTLSEHLSAQKEHDEREIKKAMMQASAPPPIPNTPPVFTPPPIPSNTNPDDNVSAADAVRRIKQKQKKNKN